MKLNLGSCTNTRMAVVRGGDYYNSYEDLDKLAKRNNAKPKVIRVRKLGKDETYTPIIL